ncbi:hypothetical protein [Hyphomonas sp.]|uniref:hypothetical protein n=1 Tax=Hyphomonas sp. TaxID=87 RepID=UPI0025C4EE07|nr:hypothetical protein [Hyphomonas sp.]
MRRLFFLATALMVSSCKPSQMFGPDSQKGEIDGGTTAPASDAVIGDYPSGTWEDGLGNAWVMTITEDRLTGKAGSESIRGLKMTGTIIGGELAYAIGFPGQPALTHGTARLINSNHAYFETPNTDGVLNAHGLLHFNHSAQVPVGQPIDLRPKIDCAGQAIKGD